MDLSTVHLALSTVQRQTPHNSPRRSVYTSYVNLTSLFSLSYLTSPSILRRPYQTAIMTRLISHSYHKTISTPHFTRFLTSWLISPFTLASLRLLFSVYIFTTLFVNIAILSIRHDYHAKLYLSYFTILCYFGLAFYFAVSAFHGFSYARHKPSGLVAGPLDRTAEEEAPTVNPDRRKLRFLHSALYATVTTLPFLVSVVFWVWLREYAFVSPLAVWSNISEHALNSAFAIFEIVVPRTDPPPFVHAITIIVVMGLYLGLSYVSHAVNGVYVYPFLDPSQRGTHFVVAVIFLLAIAAIVGFIFVHCVIRVRKMFTEERWPAKYSAFDKRVPDEKRGQQTRAQQMRIQHPVRR